LRGIIDLLEGLAQDHVIEGAVREVARFLVQVPLENGEPVLDARLDLQEIDVANDEAGLPARLPSALQRGRGESR